MTDIKGRCSNCTFRMGDYERQGLHEGCSSFGASHVWRTHVRASGMHATMGKPCPAWELHNEEELVKLVATMKDLVSSIDRLAGE